MPMHRIRRSVRLLTTSSPAWLKRWTVALNASNMWRSHGWLNHTIFGFLRLIGISHAGL